MMVQRQCRAEMVGGVGIEPTTPPVWPRSLRSSAGPVATGFLRRRPNFEPVDNKYGSAVNARRAAPFTPSAPVDVAQPLSLEPVPCTRGESDGGKLLQGH